MESPFFLGILIILIPLSFGFFPNAYFSGGIRLIHLDLNGVITHKDMSRKAILQVVKEIFNDNLNPTTDKFTKEPPSLPLTVEKLITAYYGKKDRGKIRSLNDAINRVEVANSDVDINQGSRALAAAHFDSEQFNEGQARMVDKYQMVLDHIDSSNFQLAQIECGRMLHTLQDFYSHSNWVENKNSDTLDILGKNVDFENVPNADVKTCIDCELTRVTRAYLCRQNMILKHPYLTSGYYGGQKYKNGTVIRKPTGKCSHGGLHDSFRHQSATGGINKDSPFNLLSPHYYLYKDAAKLAEQATKEMLQRLRQDVRNDMLFAMFLGIPLSENDFTERASIAFVIDIAGSMGEYIPEIQKSIPTLRSNLKSYTRNFNDKTPIRYILVPFNDSYLDVIETYNIEKLVMKVGNLRANGGQDTPRPSIGAIIRAIEASEPGSPVYVFTDTLPSDEQRSVDAQSLILDKNTPVYFALVNPFLKKRKKRLAQMNWQKLSRRYPRATPQAVSSVYKEISDYSGGQILNVNPEDLSELSTLVSSSAVRSRRTLFRSSSSKTATYHIPIDSSTLRFSISISGTQIQVIVSSPQGINAAGIPEYFIALSTRTSYISQMDVKNTSFRGIWTVNVTSISLYSILVYGISDLQIMHTVYKLDTIVVFGISEIEGLPIEGEELLVLITVETDDNLVNVTGLNLVSDNGATILPISNLTSEAQCCYAGIFVPPRDKFTFQVIGRDKSGYTFFHFTDTTIRTSSVLITLADGQRSSLTLRPGDHSSTILIVRNYGEASSFIVSVKLQSFEENKDVNPEEFISYALNSSSLNVKSNSSAALELMLAALNRVHNSLVALNCIITVQSAKHADINNYIVIDISLTSRPVPVLRASSTQMERNGTPSSSKFKKAILLVELFITLFASHAIFFKLIVTYSHDQLLYLNIK